MNSWLSSQNEIHQNQRPTYINPFTVVIWDYTLKLIHQSNTQFCFHLCITLTWIRKLWFWVKQEQTFFILLLKETTI